MKFPVLTWKRGLILAVAAPLAWLAYRTCPCIIQDDESASPFRVTSRPNNCVVFELPAFWILAGSKPELDLSPLDVRYLELRRSSHTADRFLLGLRSMTPQVPNMTVQPGPILRAKNRFAFRFYAAGAKNSAKVDDVRTASEEEWDNSEALPSFDTGGVYVDIDLSGDVVGEDVVFEGQRFLKLERYSDFSTRRMVSLDEVFIAVPSFSGPRLPEGVSFGFRLFSDPWRRTQNIDIFRISTRARIARIKGWACYQGLDQPRRIVWHGDEFFSMPLTTDNRKVLLCDFRG
jgi:hypothetical protein